MRYIITESPDPREQHHYFHADIVPSIGKEILVGGRRYQIIDIEVKEMRSAFLDPQVRVAVRRLV